MSEFTSHNRTYELQNTGAIRQTDAKPYPYDENYCATYDSEAYRRDSKLLQSLRYAFAVMAHGKKIDKILDVGYGNGAFMLHAADLTPKVYGFDVTGIEVEGCTIITQAELNTANLPKADVVTFFDSLEHMADHSFLNDLKAETIIVSLPWCHYHIEGQNWFDTDYKHRKPDEHLWHFSAHALRNHLSTFGWIPVTDATNFEDVVRKSTHEMENILTMAFRR